jgi:hypothetical protein
VCGSNRSVKILLVQEGVERSVSRAHLDTEREIIYQTSNAASNLYGTALPATCCESQCDNNRGGRKSNHYLLYRKGSCFKACAFQYRSISTILTTPQPCLACKASKQPPSRTLHAGLGPSMMHEILKLSPPTVKLRERYMRRLLTLLDTVCLSESYQCR